MIQIEPMNHHHHNPQTASEPPPSKSRERVKEREGRASSS